MNHETILPICWEDVDDDDINTINFTDVEFTEDFGPWSAGDKVMNLSLNTEGGKLVEYDQEGNLVKEVKVKLIAGSHYNEGA